MFARGERRVGCGRLRDRSGFTLLEVLVALAVMGALMGVMYRSVVVTRAGAVAFGNRSRGELVARAVLADFSARRDLRDGFYRGDRDGLSWTLSARSLDLSAQLPAAPPSTEAQGTAAAMASETTRSASDDGQPVWTPQRLVLEVAGRGRPVTAEAIRLVREPAAKVR